ncbi:MAG: PKD domain-containing protein, partial [Clostridia bacterium]|nr:PKD domain-containing protein [Clostridia bacterium]
MTGAGTFDFIVDWGDGSYTEHTGTATHTYSVPGTYTVTVLGEFPHFGFGDTSDSKKLLSVEQWGDQAWGSMEQSFYNCSNVVINATDVPNLSGVDSMAKMFSGAT